MHAYTETDVVGFEERVGMVDADVVEEESGGEEELNASSEGRGSVVDKLRAVSS